ncbi:hypothetical protein RCO48_27310 [Peribacillus frigoritolerans]|nr:hypothetical protein [Peribacillus frigoritolerans]
MMWKFIWWQKMRLRLKEFVGSWESHLTGVRLILWKTIEEFKKGIRNQQPEFVILDMDIWTDESEAMGVFAKAEGNSMVRDFI